MAEISKAELAAHVTAEHHQSPVAEYIKEVVYGGVDGIITTFAVVAGFSGAALSGDETFQLGFIVVLLFGLANLFADAVSMGHSNYLAVRSDQDLYASIHAQELREIRANPEFEVAETVTIMQEKGFSAEDARALAALYRKNENYWADFMMSHELEMPDPRSTNPLLTGIATSAAFVVFGFVPLIPFVLSVSFAPGTAFVYSCIGTFIALILLGIVKWRIVGTTISKSIGEIVIVGGVAAAIAFFVGTFFSL